MAASPEIDVRNALNTLIGSLTTGTNLFAGKMRETGPYVPDAAVFVQIIAGTAPQAFGAATSFQQFASAVNILLRSDPDDYAGSHTLVKSIQTALDKVALAGYIEVRALQADPYGIGEDIKRRHYWELNIELIHDR